MTIFKTGDIVRRKDMPQILYRITGVSSEWDAYTAKLDRRGETRGLPVKEGLIFKTDDRWEIADIKGV